MVRREREVKKGRVEFCRDGVRYGGGRWMMWWEVFSSHQSFLDAAAMAEWEGGIDYESDLA